MTNEQIIEGIIDRLNDGDDDYDIEKYLERKEIDSNEFPQLIKTAKDKIVQHKLETFPKQNKLRYILWTTLFSIFILLFFFILPKLNISDGITPLSILGAVCISFTGFLSFIHYKSWLEDFIVKVGKPKLDYQVYTFMSLLPNVILYFIISWCFSSANNTILKETQEDAIATVLYGNSVEGKSINFANVTVEFTTKEGKKVTAVEDVSTYDFKTFYQGQKINIIYSKDNPKNIDLLIDTDNIKELKNTQEREIEPSDLINLVGEQFKNADSKLNKISYGWYFDETKKNWVNERKGTVIKVESDGNQLVFIESQNNYSYTFPNKLLKMGFKNIGRHEYTGEKIFENEEYIIHILLHGSTYPITTIKRK
jgi:hypothetical protein